MLLVIVEYTSIRAVILVLMDWCKPQCPMAAHTKVFRMLMPAQPALKALIGVQVGPHLGPSRIAASCYARNWAHAQGWRLYAMPKGAAMSPVGCRQIC